MPMLVDDTPIQNKTQNLSGVLYDISPTADIAIKIIPSIVRPPFKITLMPKVKIDLDQINFLKNRSINFFKINN